MIVKQWPTTLSKVEPTQMISDAPKHTWTKNLFGQQRHLTQNPKNWHYWAPKFENRHCSTSMFQNGHSFIRKFEKTGSFDRFFFEFWLEHLNLVCLAKLKFDQAVLLSSSVILKKQNVIINDVDISFALKSCKIAIFAFQCILICFVWDKVSVFYWLT